ncbi:hypothetical protein HDU97_001672 [Phlyctochytrium planicorne]|nr:hypothetical protein HDU97_001672 [Phlyctochytrium planicorne]
MENLNLLELRILLQQISESRKKTEAELRNAETLRKTKELELKIEMEEAKRIQLLKVQKRLEDSLMNARMQFPGASGKKGIL